MGVKLLLFCLATILATSNGIPHQIHLLRPQTGTSGIHVEGLSCLSWRLAVETLNIMSWKTVPEECEGYVRHYMLGYQYRKDWEVVANEAFLYAQTIKAAGDGKDIWVFDIDETSLSNLSFYALHGFGKPVEHFLKAVDEITLKDITTIAQKIISSPLTMASYGDVIHVPSYESVNRKFHAK